MNITQIGIYLAIFLLCTVIFQWLVVIQIRKNKYKKRMKEFGFGHKAVEVEKKTPDEKSYVSVIKRIGARVNHVPMVAKWEVKLLKGKSVLTPGEFFLFRVISMAALAFIAYVYSKNLLAVIPIGFVGFWLPVFQLKRKTDKRLVRGSYQLADALGTMANSMRAGFSFMQAMKMIAEEFPDPLGIEFEKTLRDIKYGVSVEEAFAKMIDRFPDKELDLAVKAMLIQRSSGGNLAVLLETIQETISGRIRVKDEVKTLTAQGKMSSWIITGLPIALALYLKMVNPDYFNRLLTHPLGIAMLVVSGINIAIGWVMIRKIVRIEV